PARFTNWKWDTQKKMRVSSGAPAWHPTRRKHQAPKSKLQRSTNIQTSNLEVRLGAWRLVFLWSLVLGIWSLLEQARDLRIHQREDPFLFRAVIERTKHPDLVEPPHAVERIEKFRVTRGQLRGLEITPAQILGLECARIFRREQMKPEPASIRPRNLLRLPKERDEKQQHQISIHARLELEVARKIFRSDLAFAFLELQGRVQRVIDFLHERDERPDIAIA